MRTNVTILSKENPTDADFTLYENSSAFINNNKNLYTTSNNSGGPTVQFPCEVMCPTVPFHHLIATLHCNLAPDTES